AFALEPHVSDTTTPRRDYAANCPIIAPVSVFLCETPHHAGRHAKESAQGRSRFDRVLAAVPGDPKHDRHLFEVVHEKLLGVLAEISRLAGSSERIAREERLELLCQRRLCHPSVTNAKQLDLAVQRRVLSVVQCTDHVM